jgi:nitroreductase
MAMYNAIFKRKSVRDYNEAPVEPTRFAEISQKLQSLTPLFADIKTEFKIISSNQVTKKFNNKAPHYIAAFSEPKGAYKVNIGYMLQQMDLYLSANGFGGCWLGIPKPIKEVIESSTLEFVILLSFGTPKESLYRTSTAEFHRKPLSAITNIQGADDILEAARVAPSAVNFQNWYFTGDKNTIHAFSDKVGFLRAKLGGEYYPVNMGIALYHLMLAAEHANRKASFTFDSSKDKNPPKNMDYVATLELE